MASNHGGGGRPIGAASSASGTSGSMVATGSTTGSDRNSGSGLGSAQRRLMRDFKKLNEDPPVGVSGSFRPDNIMIWDALIFGADGTPFENGTFQLVLEFSDTYPLKPPKVHFVTKMFHPNIYANGEICLDILQGMWSPTYDVASILTSIQSLLNEPNPNSPANHVAAKLYSENLPEYERQVRVMVERSWVDAEQNSDQDDDGGDECCGVDADETRK